MLSSPFSFHLPPSISLPNLNKDHHRKRHRATSLTLKTDDDGLHHLLNNFHTPYELKQVHARLIKTNTSLSILSTSRVAFVCALTPCFPYARQILHRFEKAEIFVWNSCLKDFAEGNSPMDAIMLFYWLRHFDVIINSFTCSFVLKACLKLLDLKNGRVVHGFVEKLGFQSNLFLQNTILHLYFSCGAINDAVKLFESMSQRDVITWNTMITQMVKREDINGAFELFSQMPEKNIRSWTSMISGYVQCGKPKEAINLFTQMEEAGESPNEVTIVAVLAACADLGNLDLGKKLHHYSNKKGFKKNVKICNTLIDMYVKCGCLNDARKVFEEMDERERTIISWSSMIVGLAMHGKGEESFELFNKMIQIGMNPNGVTFIGLLHACSHMGLIPEGRKFFTSMIKDYGIIPQIGHYGCMVDLYSRAGLLEEAHEFIKNMPIKPNGVVWGALLGGCKVHKNTLLAEEATKHLQELDPLNDGYYVVLSNIYAEAERWDDTARVRKLMREKGVKKTPGSSSITVNGKLHEFVAGDETHPQSEEISKKWEILLKEMKLKGYEPNTSVVLLDMEEDQKVRFLYRHSEKLACVFGLINISSGTPIRIMKNLRVCEDCHVALKLISEIVDRDIVIRDRNRFHHFKDGLCSCKDYW